MSNIFDLHTNITNDYKNFVSSFINIRNDVIREKVESSLAHDFYKVDYLPENDRIRFNISLIARKEILKRLLQLNHKIHEEELAEAQSTLGKKPAKRKAKKETISSDQTELF